PYYYVQSPPQSVEFAPNSDMATLSGQKTMGMRLSLATMNVTAGAYSFGPSTVVVNRSTTMSSAGTGLAWGFGPVTEGAEGYWAMPANGTYIQVDNGQNSTILQALKEAYGLYHEFTPGSYTIVAEDYWNQTDFAYFDVQALPVGGTAATSGAGANTAVATVTVTTTFTLQASQATTTYAIPTTDCTYMPVVTTTTTTITVGPTPPASTTTTTVTTTSTSYSQTVTMTSCTFSALPWVTSTVTSTATP
ncbi:MAG: hypothetical protein ACRD6W_12430, partial [Nitrososphaerales archaeon]